MIALQALYGGTFDPVHYGHINSIEFLADLIGLKRVVIIPNNNPPHRRPEASGNQRKIMLKLAIANKPLFLIDERELCRKLPSYTSQTLQEWRAECGPRQPIAFIIGQDSLINLPSWYQCEIILDNSHLIVCNRPGYPLTMKEKHYQRWLERHLVYNYNSLYARSSGYIYMAKTPCFNISSTIIRNKLQHKQSCKNLMPPPVLEYILQYGLYQKNYK